MKGTSWLVQKATDLFASRPIGRRDFLNRVAYTGTALAVAPRTYLLERVTAVQAFCACVGANCPCGSACCDGYTEFCCTITGHNRCPPGTIPAGWWRADGSVFCSGPRYYVDCNEECGCAVGCGPFCVGGCTSTGIGCGCANGDCNNRRVACNQFRYGQCNQQVACVGRITCRVVSCDPIMLYLSNCSGVAAVDDTTANHNNPCLQAEPWGPLPDFSEEFDVEHGMAVDVQFNPSDPASGYTLDRWGGIHAFGAAKAVRHTTGYWAGKDVARRLVVTDWTTPAGYVMDLDGALHPFGGAPPVAKSAYWRGGKVVPFSEL
jgi:hypothetical protein